MIKAKDTSPIVSGYQAAGKPGGSTVLSLLTAHVAFKPSSSDLMMFWEFSGS